jgi:hypothetical protein
LPERGYGRAKQQYGWHDPLEYVRRRLEKQIHRDHGLSGNRGWCGRSAIEVKTYKNSGCECHSNPPRHNCRDIEETFE